MHKIRKKLYLCTQNQLNRKVMEATTTINNSRTREEIMAWWQRAKERKAAWEEKMQKKFDEEALIRKQADESHYYDIK